MVELGRGLGDSEGGLFCLGEGYVAIGGNLFSGAVDEVVLRDDGSWYGLC